MKKAILMLAAVALMGVAQAAQVSWSVTFSEEAPGQTLFASLIAIDTTTSDEMMLEVFSNGEATGSQVVQQAETRQGETSVYTTGVVQSDLGSWSDRVSLEFVLELYDERDILARTGKLTLEDLKDALDDGMTALPAIPFNFTYVTVEEVATPEPTSGMLMVLGAGLLGLRRRKRERV